MTEEDLCWIRQPDISSHRGTIQRAIQSHSLDLDACDDNGRTLALRLIVDDESSLLDTLVDETLLRWKSAGEVKVNSPW